MDSILTSIKKLLGINAEYKHFDDDLIIHINSVFMILNQMGVGPSEGFSIRDDSAKWNDFIADSVNIESVKSYIHLKVKMFFDPPTQTAVSQSYTSLISELENRLHMEADDKSSIRNGDSTEY